MTARTSLTSMLVGSVLLVAPPLLWQHSLPAANAGDTSLTDPVEAPDLPAVTSPDPTPAPASEAPEPPEPAPTPGVPVRLLAASIDLDAPLDPVGIEDDGAMELPEDVRRVGWYEPGVRPGEAGSAVLASHVDSRTQGTGALFDLRELEPGDEVVTVDDAGWTWTWEVTARTTHPRGELPVEELFRWDGPEQLRIITCGGTFDADRGSYSHNIVVHTVPRGEPLPPGDTTTGEAEDASR